MPLTVTKERTVFGNKRVTMFGLAFDSSYPAGGEALTPGTLGLTKIDSLTLEGSSAHGYTMHYDHTNQKVKVFAPAPPIVIEEQQTIASNAVTLNYPAAAIINIATATATQLLIEPSDTLAANEVQLSAAMSWGTRPTLNFHASTSGVVKITYITQAWKEVWDNRLASQAGTAAAHVVDTGETLCFVESMLAVGSTGSSRPKYIRGGDASATGEVEVDWTDSGAGTAGDTTFTFNATDAITSITYTAIKLPASGFMKERFIEDEDLTMSSGTGASAFPILMPAYCGQIPDFTAANERDPHHLMMPSGDALGTAGECAIDWHLVKTLAGTQIRLNDTTSDAVSFTYLKGLAAEIPFLVPLEIKNGTDLSGVTSVKGIAFGR